MTAERRGLEGSHAACRPRGRRCAFEAVLRPHNASEDQPRYGLEVCGRPWVARHGQVQPPPVVPIVRRLFLSGRFAITDGLGVEFAPAMWICVVGWSPCPSPAVPAL